MKNKGKRMISLFLVLVFVLSLSPVSFATGSSEEGQEPAPEIQTSGAGGEQSQSGGAPEQGGQEAPAAQTGSAESAGVTQPASAAESATQPAPAAESATQTTPVAESAVEAIPLSREAAAVEVKGGVSAAETPAADTKAENSAEAAGIGKTEGAQTPLADVEASGTGTDDVKSAAEGDGSGEEKALSNLSAVDTSGETGKTEQSSGNQPDGNQTVEPASEEQQPENEAGKAPAKKENQPDTKSETTVAKAAVQSAPAKANTAAKGTDAGAAAGNDYVVTPKDGSVIGTEDSNTLQITGNGSVEIELNNNVTESGKSIVIGSDDNSEEHSIIVTLKNVVVAAKEKLAGILVKANAKLTLLLSGESTVTGGENHAGVEVEWTKEGDSPKYGSLTIDGDGTLNATGGSGSGGAGIGGSKGEKGVYGDITINGGTINATGTSRGAGIGSSNNPAAGTSSGSFKYIEDQWGTITINGGDITAKGVGNGAGIGGGNHTSSGKIVINGGTVYAEGDSGIGSGLGSSDPNEKDEKMRLKGPGYYYADVTINGGTVNAHATNNMGAGIGGGMYGDAYVTITGGDVTATVDTGGNPYQGGAGIGGGYQGVAKVEISGGTVNATGGHGAPGIGNGALGTTNIGEKQIHNGAPTIDIEDSGVTITGGIVTAQGGAYAAGIGSGNASEYTNVTITGGTVTATGYLSSEDEMKGGAGIGSGMSSAPDKPKYFKETETHITIGGDATVVATGGWGASGIGSGAGNKTAESIDIDVNDAQVRAFSDGTKFAIDSRDGKADIDVAGDILQATFVFPYDDGTVHQDPRGLKTIIVTNDKTGETVKLITTSDTVGMLDGYRSFATTVSEAGSYTVYTDEASIGQGGGRYFGKGETEVRDPARPLSEMTRYTVTNGALSDTHFLFPVKSVVVTKVVVAEGGLDKSQINTTCYFALWDRSKGEYVQRDGKTWIESIDIVGGVPQSRAIFADVNDSPEGGYGIWEVDKNGRDEGIIGMTFGSYELRLVETRHGTSGDNDAEIDDDNWTDEVSVINTYFPVPDPDPTPDPTPVPVGPGGPLPEEIDEDEVPLAMGSLTNQLGECFD